MKKRILSFLLALLMVVSIMPMPTYAEGSTDVTITPTETPTEAATETTPAAVSETPCGTCGQLGCTSEHLTWCTECKKDDCGVDHTAPQPCTTCGSTECDGTHENWCADCKKDNCGVDHTTPQPCGTCGNTACDGTHENWCADCKMDNCGKTHVFCETCQKNDCGVDHNVTEPTETPTDPGTTIDEDTASDSAYLSNKGKKANINPIYAGSLYICADPSLVEGWATVQPTADPLFTSELMLVITDVYDNGAELWYKVSAAEGYTLPASLFEKPWVFQNIIGDSPDYNSLIIVAESEPDEPENPCGCCDTCTGKENCPCECDNCAFKVVTDPECDCGITGDVQYHAIDCPIYLNWVEIYVVKQSVEEISSQWSTLDKNTRESILAILAENAPEKLEELKSLLPDMNVTKEAVIAGAKLVATGDIPVDVSLEASPVTADHYNSAIFDYVPNSNAVLFAIDITLLNSDGSKWQPYSGETVTVSLDAAALGLADNERVRLLHDHDGSVEDLGTYDVANGILSFKMDKFSTIYAVSITTVSQNAFDGVIYFDLNAGNITINGNSYTGYRFDGTDTAKEVTGTLEAGQSYYVYQSNASNKTETGLFNTADDGEDPVYEMRLPRYDRVENWASFITNNTDIDSNSGVIATWNTRAGAVGRSATPNKITVSGNLTCSMVIDNVWSSYQQSSGQGDTTGAIKYDPTGSAKLTLKFKGDNRFATIYYHATKSQGAEIIFAGDADSTVTVANLTQNTNYNYWKSAIGADDGTDGSAAGIVINSGYIFAGTNAKDDCTAIGGGGNGYGGVTINGGTVTAVVTSSGAAIGGGIGKTSVGGQSDVKITGGHVYAYNFSCVSGGYSNTGVAYIPAAAIGGGSSARATCNPCTVEISGGYVFARSVGGTAIGGGSSADSNGGASNIKISGGTVDAASIAGTIGGQEVKAGAAIGGGTGGTNGTGGNCVLTISGNPIIYTGSIGGGKTLSKTKTIGSATVNISGGTLQGQVIMASGAASDCSFTMSGGTIDNTAALSGSLNADSDLVFTNNGTGLYHTYTFLEDNGGAVYVENGVATLSGGTVQKAGANNGGAFYVTGGTFNMTGGKINNTSAKETGGAICVVNGTANISNGTISNITAPNGGAAAVNGGTFNMTGGTVSGFRADTNGGAVYVMGGTAKVGGTITGSTTVTEAQKGGAVYVGGGTFEMTGGSMTDCNASIMGGAVCVEKVGETSGAATVSNGDISNVHAPNGGAVAVSGGSFTMSGGNISGVKATSDGESIDGLGGAVYVNDGNATVSGGSITGHETNPEAGSGGGVYVKGGSFIMSGGAMTNFNVTGNGGMVCVTGEGAAATIQGGTISGNPAADVNEAANGGAVYVGGGSFTIDGQGKIINCNATQSGGGVYLADGTFTVQGGSFENCTAAVNGGGVYMGNGTFDMDGGSFKSCTAAEYGGGVYLGGGTFDLGGNGSFESCTATKDGGGIYLASGTFEMPGGSVKACSAKNGGGVYLAGGTFNMNGGTFEACQVDANGGAVCIMNGTANIKGGTIQGDNTVSENVISANNAEAIRGGGIYVGGGKLDMEAGTITKCSATYGGAAYITAGECNMKGGTISYNYAVDGGAMYVHNTPVVYGNEGGLSNITVERNVATNNGGGMFIHNESESTSITNGVIRKNTAGNFGGGIYHEGEDGSCTVSGTGQIRGNTAKNGGGLYIIGGSTLNVIGGHITENQAVGKPADTVKTAYNHVDNVGVGGGVYVGPGTTIKSSFTMAAGKAAGIYANTADFAADDLYANIDATVLSLPNVDGMSLGDSMTATGWYCDYAAGDTAYNNSTLLIISQFPNPNAVTADSIERYRHAAKFSETAPYLVNESLGNVSGKYVCLTIGSNIINFGQIVISKSGSESDDQYFVFRIEATSLENSALELPVFEVTVRGNSSVTIDHVPFGQYTISEVESWSWRYEVEGQNHYNVKVDDPDTAKTVSFVNRIDTAVAYDNEQQSSLWLDGNSQSRVNVWNQKQTVSQNTWNLLGGLFRKKEDES